MKTHYRDGIRSEAGFTLVELAVVMVIIGLLIGGILKGQEMIENAKVNATISQLKAIDAASNTFQDMYGAIPGDMDDASDRIPGVAAASDGNGDNSLGAVAPFAIPAAGANENTYFFQHLGGSDLLVGADASMADYLEAEIADVAFAPGQQGTGAAMGLAPAGNARAGRYIAAQNVTTPADAGLSPLQAGRIDRKLDDGLPDSGSVISDGGANCGVAATRYTEDYKGVACKTAMRLN